MTAEPFRGCRAAGRLVGFSTADMLAERRKARLTCPHCSVQLVGRIVRSEQGRRLGTPMVAVPAHIDARNPR